MIPIIHRQCGTQVMWYLRDTPINPDDPDSDIMHSSDVRRMDGTQPNYGEALREICSGCGGIIDRPTDLIRCFNEFLVPRGALNKSL